MAEQKAIKHEGMKTSTALMLLGVGVVIAIIIFLIPAPAPFTDSAWKVLGLLIPIVMVWASDAVPVGVASMLFLALCICFGLVKESVALAGFTNHLTWLMFGAFALAVAMNTTGLSKRLTFLLLSLARGYWGLVISAYVANLVLLAVPSSAARSGILAPLLNAVMDVVDRPNNSNFSRFLTYNFCMSTNLFIGIMFLTGGAANGVMLTLYEQSSGATLGVVDWTVIMFLPCVVLTGGLILFCLIICGRPEKELTEKLKGSTSLKEQYQALGKITTDEIKVVIAFVLAILLWAFSEVIEIRPGYSAIVIAGLLFIPGIGVFKNGKQALGRLNWTIILLIGAVMGLGGILTTSGLADAISQLVFNPILDPLNNMMGIFGIAIAVAIIAAIVHLFIPSPNNVTIMTPLLVTWGVSAQVEPAAILAFLGLLNLMSDKLVYSAYQMPPYFVFLGMDVTDLPSFNSMLLKLFPIAVVLSIVAAFVAYGVINITGMGI